MSKIVLKCSCGFKHTGNEHIVFTRDEVTKKYHAQCGICEKKLNIKNLGGIKCKI